jgi:hypothetical protein
VNNLSTISQRSVLIAATVTCVGQVCLEPDLYKRVLKLIDSKESTPEGGKVVVLPQRERLEEWRTLLPSGGGDMGARSGAVGRAIPHSSRSTRPSDVVTKDRCRSSTIFGDDESISPSVSVAMPQAPVDLVRLSVK